MASWWPPEIAADGAREILGLNVGASEGETFWRSFLLRL